MMLKYSIHSRLREFHLKKMMAGIGKGNIFADIGCGLGYLTKTLGCKYSIPIGIDSDIASLRIINNNIAKSVCATADKLPIADNTIDVVLCSEVLEHLPEPLDSVALSELVRITSKHGRIFITVPALRGLRANSKLRNLGHDTPGCGEYHYRKGYTIDNIKYMISNIPGASIVNVKYSMFLFSEIFMDLLKLAYLGKRHLKEHSDMALQPDGVLFKLYKLLFPIIHKLFIIEDILFCPLFGGHILIIEIEKC